MKWSVIQNNLNQKPTLIKKKNKKKLFEKDFNLIFRENSLKKQTEFEAFTKDVLSKCLRKNHDFFAEFIFQNRRFDFFVPKLRLAIEIDGGYHNHSSQKKKDNATDFVFLKKYNIKVIRIKNEETKDKVPLLFDQIVKDLKALNFVKTKGPKKAVKNSLKRMKKIVLMEEQRTARVKAYETGLKAQKVILRKAF